MSILHTISLVGGAGALSYFAASDTNSIDNKHTLRLSLDKGGSLIGDVRLLGAGLLMAVAYMGGVSEKTKNALNMISVASLASLATTEVVRYRLAKSGRGVAGALPVAPQISASYGGEHAHARSASAWAAR